MVPVSRRDILAGYIGTHLRKSHGTSPKMTNRGYSSWPHESARWSPTAIPEPLATDYLFTSDTRSLSLNRIMSSTPSNASQDDWIRVTSRDGFSFIAKRSVVFRSGTLRNMLDERRTSLSPRPRTHAPCYHTTHPRQLQRVRTKALPRGREVPVFDVFLPSPGP